MKDRQHDVRGTALPWTVGMALFGVVAASAALAPPVRAQDGPTDRGEPQVAQMFRKRCVSCHSVPDLGIRTDRAWLGQVERTA